MSMNEFDPDHEKSVTDAEGVMFASQPAWERNRKRRGFGGRKTAAPSRPEPVERTVAPEPRSFAAEDDMMLDRPVGATAAGVTAGAMTADEAPLAAPIGRPSTRADRQPRSKGTGPAMIATGAVAIVAIAAGGWYLSRPHGGVPTLTPGSTTSQVAAAPLPPVDMPPTARAQMANPAANPPPSMRLARAAPIHSTAPARAHARPAAAASSASATGVNASATASLPDAPVPYSRLNPNTPAPVNPAPAPTQAPTQAAPPPATTTPAEPPATIPQTPPTQTPPQSAPPSDTTPPDSTPPSSN